MHQLHEEDSQIAREAWWLLRFFSSQVDELWAAVPGEIDPVLFVLGEYYAEVDQPLLILSLILSEHLGGSAEYFDYTDPELDVLDDLRNLLSHFMIEGPPGVFREPDEPTERGILGTEHMIWRVVRRLCLIALERPSVQRWRTEDLSVEDLLNRYTYPPDRH